MIPLSQTSKMKDSHVLKAIFDKYHLDLLRFIGRKYGNRNDTEDIVQDAYHNVIKSGKAGSLDNARAYLYQTANNLALNRIEKEKTHNKYINSFNDDEKKFTLECAISAYKDLEKIESALNTLAPKYRKTFTLNRVHGKSYKEISSELGIPASTVEKHIIKVLKHLRKYVKREEMS